MKREFSNRNEQLQGRTFDRLYRRGEGGKIPLQLEKLRRLIGEYCNNLKKGRSEIKILDIGCGTGELLANFVGECECFGIDISDEAVSRAREKKIEAKKHDVETGIPFVNDYFDIVLMSEVLEHVVDTDFLLTEIGRVLKKNGFFILTVPNVNSPISLILQLIFDYPPLYSSRYKSTHVRDFTLRTLRKALANNGLKPIRTEGTYIYPFKKKVSQTVASRIPRFSEIIILVIIKEGKARLTPPAVFDVREL